MILLDIVNNVKNDLEMIDTECNSKTNIDVDSSKLSGKIELLFKNNTNGYIDVSQYEFISHIIGNSLKENESIRVKCKICCFLGSGSYGRVYKIRIKKRYYALKISENENPHKFKQRYESFVSVEQLKKYIIRVDIAGSIRCGKFRYFSIMEFGGTNLKSLIPIKTNDKLSLILNQLYNIAYLCGKYRLLLTDFKLNNIVVDQNHKLKIIDIYMDCESYSPCVNCRIVKTYSSVEIDKMNYILEDPTYIHTYQYMSLGVGLIDLLCTKSAHDIVKSLGAKFGINMGIKQILPLIQISCYNYSHQTNKSLKKNYAEIYTYKKRIESKYPFVKDNDFYETFIKMIDVKSAHKKMFPTQKLQIILDSLFSACPDDRTLGPLKKCLSEKNID